MFVSLSLENCGNVGRAWRRSCSASAAHRRDLPSQVPRPSVSCGAQLGLARRKPRITHRRQHGFPPVTGRVLSGEHVPCRIWKQYKRSGMGTPLMFTYEFILWTKSLKHKVCSMCLWYNAMFSNIHLLCRPAWGGATRKNNCFSVLSRHPIWLITADQSVINFCATPAWHKINGSN